MDNRQQPYEPKRVNPNQRGNMQGNNMNRQQNSFNNQQGFTNGSRAGQPNSNFNPNQNMHTEEQGTEEEIPKMRVGKKILNISAYSQQADGGYGMATAEQMMKFARDNHLGWHPIPFFQQLHFGRVAKAFSPGEYALYSFIGRYVPDANEDMKYKYSASKGWYGFVITNYHKIIYAHWQIFNNSHTQIPFTQINNFNTNSGIVWGTLRIETFKDNFAVFWTKRAIEDMNILLGDSFNKFTRGGNNQPFNPAMNNMQPQGNMGNMQQQNNMQPQMGYTQQGNPFGNGQQQYNEQGADDELTNSLIQLKGLLSRGIIDQEEFNAKKAEILKRL